MANTAPHLMESPSPVAYSCSGREIRRSSHWSFSKCHRVCAELPGQLPNLCRLALPRSRDLGIISQRLPLQPRFCRSPDGPTAEVQLEWLESKRMKLVHYFPRLRQEVARRRVVPRAAGRPSCCSQRYRAPICPCGPVDSREYGTFDALEGSEARIGRTQSMLFCHGAEALTPCLDLGLSLSIHLLELDRVPRTPAPSSTAQRPLSFSCRTH